MNKRVLLVSIDEIIQGSVIETNVDYKVLSRTIQIVQETNLKAILGQELFTDVIDAVYDNGVSGASVNSLYVNLIDVCKPYLIAKTVADFIIINNYKITNKGILKLSDDSASNIDDADLQKVADYYRNLTSTYKKDILTFLKDNQLSTWGTDNTIANDGGWYLGVDLCTTPEVVIESNTSTTGNTEALVYYQQIKDLKNVLLISDDELKAYSVVEANTDSKLIANTIKTVQQVYLQPILGETLYNQLMYSVQQNVLSGATITGLYDNLLVLVKQYLINKVVAEFVIPNNYKLTNKGVLKLSDNSAQTISDNDLQKIKDHFDNISTSYKIQVLDFIKRNNLLDCNQDKDITGEAGWWLGGETLATSKDNSIPQSIIYTDPTQLDNDRYIVSGELVGDTLSLLDNSGNTVSISGFSTSGAITVDNDQYITGATIQNDVIVFVSNSGNTFNVPLTAYTADNDIYITSVSFDQSTGVLDISRSDGLAFEITGFTSTLTDRDTIIVASEYNQSTGTLTLTDNTGVDLFISGFYTGYTLTSSAITSTLGYTPLSADTFVTGGTYDANVFTFRNNTGGTFSINTDLVTTGTTQNITGTKTFNVIDLQPTTGSTFGVITQNGSPLLHRFGTNNLWLGGAGNFNASSATGRNIGIGVSGLTNITTGNNNIAIGYQTLGNNTTSNQNVAVGNQSLFTLTGAASSQTAIGHQALFSFTGYPSSDPSVQLPNVAIGAAAMANTTNGYGNVAVGLSALFANTTGNNNAALGYWAMRFNTTGAENTAFGTTAMRENTTGNQNVALGRLALRSNQTGSTNVAVGFQAGNSALGSGNVFIGANAGANETGSNKLYIANTNTSTPLIGGDFTASTVDINANITVTGTSRLNDIVRVTKGGLNFIDIEANTNSLSPYIRFFRFGNHDVYMQSISNANIGGYTLPNSFEFTSATTNTRAGLLAHSIGLTNGLIAVSNATNGDSNVHIAAGAGGSSYVSFRENGVADRGLIGYRAGTSFLQVRVSGATNMNNGTFSTAFFNNGNVGVGTTNDAGFRFDVSGTTRLNGNTQVNGIFTIKDSTDVSTYTTLNSVGTLTLTPANLTGAQASPALDISQTWNTSGSPSAIRVNITNTGSVGSNLLQLQVGGANRHRFDLFGNIIFGTQSNVYVGVANGVGGGDTSGLSLRYMGNQANNSGYDHHFSNTANRTYTSGSGGVLNIIGQNYQVTTGGGIYNHTRLAPLINQTGSATGVTRGLFIEPTLSSAADFRAIEVTNGSIVLPYTAVSTTYSIPQSAYLIDCTSGTFTATLPTAVGATGKNIIIKNSGSGAITIATTTSQTIDGSTTYSLGSQYKYVHVVSNGSNWIIIANN